MNEYDITYVTKEFLIKNGWKIVTFNPPGAQGTFTIPNPKKDPNYKGQTGSESPDIIAFKFLNNKNILLIIESKPLFNEDDVKKLRNLILYKERREILFSIIKNQCIANDIPFDENKEYDILLAKAHGGETHNLIDFITFKVSLVKEGWDPKHIDPKKEILEFFKVEEIHPSK